MKRSASIAFPISSVAKDTVTSKTSLLTSRNNQTPVYHRVVSLQKPPKYGPRHTTSLRRKPTLDAIEVSNPRGLERPLKRQKVIFDDVVDGWDLIEKENIGPVANANGVQASNQSHLNLLQATFALASYTFGRLPVPGTMATVVNTKPPHSSPLTNQVDVEMIDDYPIEHLNVPSPSKNEPPSSAYNATHWALLSRYPNLVNRIRSKKFDVIREQHAKFLAFQYAPEANPRLTLAPHRRTSPLSPLVPISEARGPRCPSISSSYTRRMVFEAQKPGATPSRWAAYPTATNKHPFFDNKFDAFRRNLVMLNLGEWMSKYGFTQMAKNVGLRQAVYTYESFGLGQEDDGCITPLAETPPAFFSDFQNDIIMQ